MLDALIAAHPDAIHFAVKSLTHGLPLVAAVYAGHRLSARNLEAERRLAELRDKQSVDRDRALGNSLSELRRLIVGGSPAPVAAPPTVAIPEDADAAQVESAQEKRAVEHLVTLRRTVRGLRDLLDRVSSEVDAAEARFRGAALDGVDTSLLGPPSA